MHGEKKVEEKQKNKRTLFNCKYFLYRKQPNPTSIHLLQETREERWNQKHQKKLLRKSDHESKVKSNLTNFTTIAATKPTNSPPLSPTHSSKILLLLDKSVYNPPSQHSNTMSSSNYRQPTKTETDPDSSWNLTLPRSACPASAHQYVYQCRAH